MDVIEPLWFAVTTVHELIKSNQEIKGEIKELGETLKLITIAIRPLMQTAQSAVQSAGKDSELSQVFEAMKSVIEEAETTIKEMTKEKRGRFHFITKAFSANKHVEEIKNHMEKLRNLTPILNLAVNAMMHTKKESETKSNVLAKSNSEIRFSAKRIVKNAEAKPFWLQHFGDVEYKVSWNRFVAAFEHEYGNKLVDGSLNEAVRLLKMTLDRNGDNEVDIYEYDTFTKENCPWEAYIKLKEANDETAGRNKMKRKMEISHRYSLSPSAKESPDRKKLKGGMKPPISPSTKGRTRSAIITQSPSPTREEVQTPCVFQLILIGVEYIFELDCIQELKTVEQSEELTLGRVFFREVSI
eukprot:TRINITY_DN7634_c0_g1_i6.p1 TRINITY_DN7634_c0_g1~~TRINITY_DN7634_c0_g1_i6.p1  ORF type:complete len:356 (+),score=128.44 TRINITY_DN7634_c0_g1_i6:54-1121(+)